MRRYRIITRSLVLLLMAGLVYLNLYEKKAGQLGAELEIARSPVLSAYDWVLGDVNKPMLFRGWAEGGLWSFRILSLSLSDPLAFVTSTVTARAINRKLALSIVIPTLLILLFGRFFCAWVCPYSLFAEAGNGIRRILRRFGIEYFRFDLPPPTARLYLIVSLILGAILSVPITNLIYPPRILTEGIYHWVISGTLTAGVIFLLFLWLGEVLFAPHLFCRRVCPGGALMSLLGRFRVWRVERVAPLCDSCAICNRACPYDLDPAAGVFPGECDNCGLCIEACDARTKEALHYTLSLPFKRRNAKDAA